MALVRHAEFAHGALPPYLYAFSIPSCCPSLYCIFTICFSALNPLQPHMAEMHRQGEALVPNLDVVALVQGPTTSLQGLEPE